MAFVAPEPLTECKCRYQLGQAGIWEIATIVDVIVFVLKFKHVCDIYTCVEITNSFSLFALQLGNVIIFILNLFLQ